MLPLTCKGFTACGMAAGIKNNGDLDLGLLVSDRPAGVAAVFTNNRVQAAPVLLDRERVRSGIARAVIVNAGLTPGFAETADPSMTYRPG